MLLPLCRENRINSGFPFLSYLVQEHQDQLIVASCRLHFFHKNATGSVCVDVTQQVQIWSILDNFVFGA